MTRTSFGDTIDSYSIYRKETVMTLANGEQIIKDWEYATQKGSTGKMKKSLIVTNKRIVHEMHSHIARSHNEIPLNSVKSISMSSVRKTPVGAILAIIFGAIIAIAGLVMGFGQNGTMATMLPMLLVGVILIVIGILGLGHGAFTLEIATKGLEGSSLYIGTSNIVTKKRRKQKKVKIKIDLKVVDDIMDTLGAILLDNIKE